MKLIFQPAYHTEMDWVEHNNTQVPLNNSYFNCVDLRAWFLKWVFK